MRIDDKVTSFLAGERFSNGHSFRIDWQPVIDRNSALRNLVYGKRVVHVGCADHLGLIAQKRRSGRYLHDILLEAASSVVGLDVNTDALMEMKNIGFGDLYTPDDFPYETSFDVIVAADVIEHVSNVGDFLNGLRRIECSRIVITTPNAFRLMNRRLWRSELINTDHRYWFSPYTLARILRDSRIVVEKMYYTDSVSWRRPLSSILKWKFPVCRDGLIAVGRIEE